MKPLSTDPMRQHARFIDALCQDWREAGTVTRVTPRAKAVCEISRQLADVSTAQGVGDRYLTPAQARYLARQLRRLARRVERPGPAQRGDARVTEHLNLSPKDRGVKQ